MNDVLYSRNESIAEIELNRPGALNTITPDMLQSISEMLDQAGGDTTVSAVVLRGAGQKAFSAGADISVFNSSTPEQIMEIAHKAKKVTQALETLGKPSMALIQGYALGGGLELAEACWLRVSSTEGRFGHPEVKLGAVAGWGGTARLARLIGPGRASDLLVTGRIIDAQEALTWGLITRLCEPDKLMAEGMKLLCEVLSQSRPAVRLSYEAMLRGLQVPLDEALDIGISAFGKAALEDDFKEGTSAFLNKRPAEFKSD